MKSNDRFSKRSGNEQRRGSNVHNMKGGKGQAPVHETIKDSSMQSAYIKELAVIDYQGKRNPALWESARSKLEIYVSRIYGYECGHLFKNNEMFKYPDLPELDLEKYTEVNDPLGFARLERVEDIKARKRDVKKLTDNNKLVYTLVKGQCTTAMWNQVKTSKKFEDFDPELDLEALWGRISEVLLTAIGENQSEHIVKENAIIAFQSLRQRSHESVSDFHKRFEVEIQSMLSLDMEAQLGGERQIAVSFLNKLDKNRFTSLLVELSNSMQRGRDEYPKTLAEALSIAQNYKVVIGRESDHQKVNVAFYAADVKFDKSVKKYEDTKTHGLKNEKQNFNKNKKFQNSKFQNSKTPRSRVNDICNFCGETGHWKYQCPNRAKDKTKDEEIYCVLDSTKVCYKVSNNDQLSEWDVLLDSQASISLFKNKELLTNIKTIKNPIKVNGIGGADLIVDKIGDYSWFGTVYYEPKASANVLCLADVAAKFDVTYGDKEFVVTTYDTTKHFIQKNKLHVLQNFDNENILLNTVFENKKIFTKREIEHAEIALELFKNFGYPSVGSLKSMINSGINSPISIKDIDNCIQIFGEPVAGIKGRTTSKKPLPVLIQNNPIKYYTDELIILNVDIMYINKFPYLLSYSEKIGLLMSCPLVRRTSIVIKDALESMIIKYHESQFGVSVIKCDSEAGISTLESYFKKKFNISFNVVSKEQHVPAVERKIRQVKERIRGILSTIPYNLCKILFDYLVYYVVKLINLIPMTYNNVNISPIEIFSGRRLDFNKDFKISFGQYVQIPVDNDNTKNSVMHPRTIDAISLVPKDNYQGSQLFLNIANKTVITRDRWKVIPLNNAIIDQLNKMAISEKNFITTENLQFSLNSMTGIISDNILDNADDQTTQQKVISNADNLREVPTVDNGVSSTFLESKEDRIQNQYKEVSPNHLISDDFMVNNNNTSNIIEKDVATSIEDNDENGQVNNNFTENEHILARSIDSDNQFQMDVADATLADNLGRDDIFTDTNFAMNTINNDTNIIVNDDMIDNKNKNDNIDATENIDNIDSNININTDTNNLPYDFRKRTKKFDKKTGQFQALLTRIEKQVNELGESGMSAMKAELQQLLDKNVFAPVYKTAIPFTNGKQDILTNQSLIKVKRNNIVKARSVGGGHRQDKSIYDILKELSSSTIKSESIFLIFTLALMNGDTILSADIVGA